MYVEKIIRQGRMKSTLKCLLAAFILTVVSTTANATLVTFDAVGSSDVSGFVQFNDSAFLGWASVSNSNITDLSLSVLSYTFDLSDVVTTSSTIVDSSGTIPLIFNGSGALAYNGLATIAFFPDGFGGTTSDGDASLALDTDGIYSLSGTNWENFFAVRWEVRAVPEPTTMLLLGLGLVGLAGVRRKMQ